MRWPVHPDMLYFGHFVTIIEHARNNEHVFKRQFHLQFWSDGQIVMQIHLSNPFQSIRVGVLPTDLICESEPRIYQSFGNHSSIIPQLFVTFYPGSFPDLHRAVPNNLGANQVDLKSEVKA